MLSPGTIIGTRYKIIRLLGQGGMSNIYICEELTSSGAPSGQVWAVKEFTATYTDPQEQEAALTNFKREAYLLGQLSHPNLPKIREYFQFQGHYYLTMEYLQGSDLGKILEQAQGPLPELKVADLGLQMTTVLYYLHCQKPTPIIFRDVKPSNIILCGDKIKLIDFGIARLFTPGKRGDTMRIGSPGYAPPEQYNGQTDLRSDIYSLGMTLHQCLTGQDPTLSPNPFVVTPVLDLNPQVSPELAAIVQKAIKLIPEERYQSMLEMKEDLRRFLKIGPSSASSPLKNTSPAIPTTIPNQLSLSSAAVSPLPSSTPSVLPTPTLSGSAHLGKTAAVSSVPLSSSPVAPVANFGPPVIIPVNDEESATWKKTALKLFLFLLTWGFLGAAGAIVWGLYPIDLPIWPEPFNSRRAALWYSLTPSDENLSPNNYRSVYKYTINRLKAAEIINLRVKSEPHDLLAQALKQNLDNLLSRRNSSFVGNAEYEKIYKGDVDKIEALTDPSGLYLDSQTQAYLLDSANTISLVLPSAPDLAHTDSPLLRGALAAQEVSLSRGPAQERGVMINPIFSPKPLSSQEIGRALNEQLCQAAPIPQAGRLNSQVVISEREVSSTWKASSRSLLGLRAQLQAPNLYLNLSQNERQPSLTELIRSSVSRWPSTNIFICEEGFACKFTASDKVSWPKNCHFIKNWQELAAPRQPGSLASGGLVLLSRAQLKANLSLPSQYKVALLLPTPAQAEKLRASWPAQWVANRRLSVWTLLSYQHPNRQALDLLNSSFVNEPTTTDLAKLYATLKAADAFTLGALYLRQTQGSFAGALANYNLDNRTFTPISCQAFTVTAHGLSPVVFPSPRQGTLEE